MFHSHIGNPPCDRDRDSPVYTAVGYVTNTWPHLQRPWWDRGIRRLDEVHVRLPLWETQAPDSFERVPLMRLGIPLSVHLYKTSSAYEHSSLTAELYSYKGMAHASPAANTRNLTPQATGFSQVHSRGGGEGGGQAMSVLLSWHEKVPCHFLSLSSLRDFGVCMPSAFLHRSQNSSYVVGCTNAAQLVEIAGPGSIVRVMTDRRTV